MVKGYVVGDDVTEVEDVGPILRGETPHPAELMTYLLNPPQMRRLTEKMQLKPHVIPAITKRSQGFISVHVEFTPDLDVRFTAWKPFFVTDKAYAIASLLCQNRQTLNLDDLEQDSDWKQAAEELTHNRIIGPDSGNPRIFKIILQAPICVRLPDGLYAIGENASGQMLRWISEHYPDKKMAMSPQFADHLMNKLE